MAVLITGLGYIGSTLASRLLADGEEVVGLENFFSTPRLPVEHLVERGIRLVEGSLADAATVEAAFIGPPIERVFHLAAQASAQPDAAVLAYTIATNFTGPRVLLDACVAHGVEQVVFASSMRLYRTPLPRRVTEQSPLEAPDLVHLSQLAGEMMLAAYQARSAAFRAAALRTGIVHGVGPVMKTDSRFLAVPQRFCLDAARGESLVAMGGRRAELAFVHLDDVVEALCRCRDLPDAWTVANVGCEVTSVGGVARAVQSAGASRGISVDVQYSGRETPAVARVIESRLSSTGFAPRRTLKEHIGEVLDHYLALDR